MLRKVECDFEVMLPVKSIDKSGSVTKRQVATCLLYQLSDIKATEEYGYFLAVTELKSIGRGRPDESSKYVVFPVTACCRTFVPMNGEVMIGTVYAIKRVGVFLKCGPMSHIYLSCRKMPNYSFVGGKNPFFLSNDLSRVAKDTVIRFMVLAVRWRADEDRSRQFTVLATIDDAALGPIQLAGSDSMDFVESQS